MKKLMLSILFAMTIAFSTATAGDPAAAQFDKIKSLAGEWSGTRFDGKAMVVTYEVVANGSAVIEKLMPEGEPNMMTMYHIDSQELMMTHYCAAQNQPRMRAEASSAEATSIRFTFMDATNLPHSTDGHMRKLVLNFEGTESLKHVWTWKEGDKESDLTFELSRRKVASK